MNDEQQDSRYRLLNNNEQITPLRRIHEIMRHISWMDSTYSHLGDDFSPVVLEAYRSWTRSSETVWIAFANENLWIDSAALSLGGVIQGMTFGCISHPDHGAMQRLLDLGLYRLNELNDFGFARGEGKWPVPLTWSVHT